MKFAVFFADWWNAIFWWLFLWISILYNLESINGVFGCESQLVILFGVSTQITKNTKNCIDVMMLMKFHTVRPFHWIANKTREKNKLISSIKNLDTWCVYLQWVHKWFMPDYVIRRHRPILKNNSGGNWVLNLIPIAGGLCCFNMGMFAFKSRPNVIPHFKCQNYIKVDTAVFRYANENKWMRPYSE